MSFPEGSLQLHRALLVCLCSWRIWLLGPLGSAKGFLYGLTFELPSEITSWGHSAVPQGWVLPNTWLGFISERPRVRPALPKEDFAHSEAHGLVPDSPHWLWHRWLEGKGAGMVLVLRPGREVLEIRMNICPNTTFQPHSVPRDPCSCSAPQLCPTAVPHPRFPSNPSTTGQPERDRSWTSSPRRTRASPAPPLPMES